MGKGRNPKVEPVKPAIGGTANGVGGSDNGTVQPESPSAGIDQQSQPAADAGGSTGFEYGDTGPIPAGNAGPTEANAANSGDTGKRRGGWPKGKPRGTGKTAESFPSYLKWFIGPLLIVHELAAHKTNTPELEIDEQEAKAICSAGDDVLAFYNKVPSPEMQVWLGFGTALSMVYGPRWVAIRTRMKREAKEREARKVQPIRPEQAFPPREPVA
jgi:hypothetical protein